MRPACFLVHVTSLQFGNDPVTIRLVISDDCDADISFLKQSEVKFEFEDLNDDGVSFCNDDILTFKVIVSEETSLRKIDVNIVSIDGKNTSFSVDKVISYKTNIQYNFKLKHPFLILS